ncbi:hypothetical protein KX928_06040 [Roseobacter sp. YSTF-M11]|uniref:Uncharacterized protein n=1 Tax=Roseobacter insulae TaxID=2859783 RepID=A0A9X1FTY0_9RHOB|nr:hypothetical protein [Roseobacter insulae]MBW4707342.1 hypothetical protein [Roseobacter insulae]
MDSFVTKESRQAVTLATTRAAEIHRTQVCALTRSVHEKSLFGDIPFSDAKFDRAFDRTLNAPEQHLGLVVALGSRVPGCCYCSIGGYFIGDGARIVSVHAICVAPDVSDGLLGGKVALRLAKGIEVWAQSQGATHILYHVTAGIDAACVDRFFQRIGMKQIGGDYGTKFFPKI